MKKPSKKTKTKNNKPQSSGKTVDKNERDEKGRFVEGHERLGGNVVGSKHFGKDFDEVLKEIAEREKITESEARKILLSKAYSEAKDGKFPYHKDIMDRYYGKPTDKVEHSGEIKTDSIGFHLEDDETREAIKEALRKNMHKRIMSDAKEKK